MRSVIKIIQIRIVVYNIIYRSLAKMFIVHIIALSLWKIKNNIFNGF